MTLLSNILYYLKKVKMWQILVGVLIVFVIYNQNLRNELDTSNREFNNLKATNSKVTKAFEDSLAAYNKLGLEYKEIKISKDSLSSDFNKLNLVSKQNLKYLSTKLSKELDKKDKEILILNNTILSIKPQTVTASTDTIMFLTDDEVNIMVNIDTTIGNIGLKGFTMTNPPKYSIEAWLNPIGMEIIITETERDGYETFLIFSDNNVQVPVTNTYKSFKSTRRSRTGFLSIFKKPELFMGYEMNPFEIGDNSPYIKAELPLWLLRFGSKLNKNDLRFNLEFKIW